VNNELTTSSEPPLSDGAHRPVPRKTGVVPNIIRLLDAYLMGYDVFVSYAWLDGRRYAEKLVAALQANRYRCFLDSSEYQVGTDLSRDAQRAVRVSNSAAIVVTPASLQSRHVRREIELFDESDEPLVPIDINQTLHVRSVRADGTEKWIQSPAVSIILASVSAPEAAEILATIDRISRDKRIQISESQTDEPSQSTVDALCKRFSFSRRVTRRLRVISAACVILVLLTGIALWLWSVATYRKGVAETKTRAVQAQGWAAQAELAMERNKPQLSLQLAAAALRVTENAHEPRSRMAEQSARNVLAQVGGRFLGSLANGGGYAVAISPNSQWLAIAVGGKELHLWDLKSPKPEASKIVLEDIDTCSFCAFTADGRWLITDGRSPVGESEKSAPYTIRLWKLDGQQPAPTMKPLVLGGQDTGAITKYEVSRDARWLALCANKAKSVQVWDLKALDPAGSLMQLGKDAIADLCFVGNDKILVARAEGGALIWDLHNLAGKPGIVADEKDKISLVTASKDGRKLVTLGGRQVRLWKRDQNDHWKPTVLAKLEGAVSWIYLIGDGRWLLSGNPYGFAYTSLVDLDSKDPAKSYFVIPSIGGPVGRYVADPKGRLLVTAAGYEAQFGLSPERIARVWLLSLDDPTKVSIELPHTDVIFDASVASTERKLATGAGDGSVRWWTIDDDGKALEVQLRAHEEIICRVMISPDDRWLVTTSVDGTARLWDLKKGNAFGAAPRQVHLSKSSTIMSPDGKWLFIGGKEAVIVSLQDSLRFDVPEPLHASSGIFSPDDRSIIAESPLSNVLSLLPVGQQVTAANCRFIKASGNSIAWHGVNKNGQWLAVASRAADTDIGATVEIFDLGDKEKYNIVKESLPNIVNAEWSPDGRLFAGAQVNGSIAVWRTTSKGMKRIDGDLAASESVTRVLFSPDGEWLASGSWESFTAKKTVWLWRMESGALAKAPIALKDAEGDISSMTWSPDGKWLAGSTIGKPLRLWHFDSGAPGAGLTLPVIPKVEGSNIRFSNDGRWLFTAPYGETPRIWDLHAAHPADSSRQLGGHSFPAVQASFSQDGRWLTTADYEVGETDAPGRSVRVWAMQADNIEESSVVLPGLGLGANQLGSTQDSQWLITSSDDGVRMTPLGVKSLLSEIEAAASRPLSETEQRQFAIPSSLFQTSPMSSSAAKKAGP
jgi:WD40 repeat protein